MALNYEPRITITTHRLNVLHEAIRILATIVAKHSRENQDPHYWTQHAIDQAEKFCGTFRDQR